jgi:arabinogalactan oligomer/maltooligosaccharide transport system substrate-binding protein
MTRMTRWAGLAATAALLAGTVTPVAAQDAPLEGTVTLWHTYGSGAGTEADALAQAVALVTSQNPGLTINVLPQDFGGGQIFQTYGLEVASGGGPDLLIAPNDSLGQVTRDLNNTPIDAQFQDAFANFVPLAIEGSSYEGQLVQVPESLKAVALYYDSAKVATPPATTDELLAAVEGGLKLGLVQGIYHNFGFAGSYGGTLMDDTGKCTADQGGFAEAFQLLADLKAAGATFDPDYTDIADPFKQGAFDAIIDGPWAAGGYVTDIPGLGVAAMPAGPAGPALPLAGVDGYTINPNSDTEFVTRVAIALVSPEVQKIFADVAYHIPADSTVAVDNPISNQFSAAVASGYPRPQSVEFGNFWAPFGNALNLVLDQGADPTEAIATACAEMNAANQIQ